MQAYDAILPAPLCRIGVRFAEDALTRLDFLPTTCDTTPLDTRSRRLAEQLEAYWANPLHVFDLRLAPAGTPFQLRVWQALLQIPAGAPTTYGALAQQLGTAARAVGQACGSNPLPLVVPCHRVVAAHGLGGFMHASAGAPLDVKRGLLEHEARVFALQ